MKNGSVIIIDDNEIYSLALKKLLKNAGYDVVKCISHAQFREIELSEQPQFIIVSFRLSKMDTLFTATWIKENHPKIKIILNASINRKEKIPLTEIKKIGIEGMVFKVEKEPEEILTALETVAGGRHYFI